MTTASVASLRPAPTMAVYGLAAIFLYLVPAIVFLLPTSLISAELASGWKGGVYKWVSTGISKPMGFLAVWCQFAMTIFYYPTPARVRRGDARLRDQSRSREQRRLDGARDHGLLLVGRLHLVPRHEGRRGSRERRPHHRHAHPGRHPGAARRRLPRAGQPVGGTDDRREPAAAVGGPREPRAHREQLPVVQRHGDERGARLVAAQARRRSTRRPSSWRWDSCCSSSSCRRSRSAGSSPPSSCRSRPASCRRSTRCSPSSTSQFLTPIIGLVLVAASLGWNADLARRPVEGPAAHLARRGLPAAVPAEAEQARRAAEPAGGAGTGDDGDRPRLRPHPGRLERVLDLLGDHHAGVPHHVPADVRRRGAAAPDASRSPARLPCPDAHRARGRGLRGIPLGPAGRVHPAVAVQRWQPARLPPHRRGRRARARAARAVPLLPVPQAVLEAAHG